MEVVRQRAVLISDAVGNGGGTRNSLFAESGYPVTTMRRACSLLSAGFLFVFLVGQSPHLVHHIFDEHQDLASPEVCAFATAAERQHSDSTGHITLPHDPHHGAAAQLTGESLLSSIAAAPVTTRAPPTASF